MLSEEVEEPVKWRLRPGRGSRAFRSSSGKEGSGGRSGGSGASSQCSSSFDAATFAQQSSENAT